MITRTITTRSFASTVESVALIPSGSVAYTRAGHGPVILLIHGLGGTRDTWKHVVDDLACTHTVLAPDLPGHGDSGAPAGDYSLGAHAAALRDLLVVLDLPVVTVVGHSLGGGVAMQFAYQFPERVERLVLISSGGLGPEVAGVLRFASSVPGAALMLKALASVPVAATRTVLSAASVLPGALPRSDTGSLVGTIKRMSGLRQRRAFLRTARSVIDWRGQTVSAVRQLMSFPDLPLLLIWGGRDSTIPPHHHATMAELLPGSQTLEVADAGHFPHETDPAAIVAAIQLFLRSQPYRFSESRWRAAFPND